LEIICQIERGTFNEGLITSARIVLDKNFVKWRENRYLLFVYLFYDYTIRIFFYR
jgi:hypothetical protein